MSWKCPSCGHMNEDAETQCQSDGWLRIASRVVLTSTATGKQVGMRISQVLGRTLLATFAGEEARYASEPQFELIKDEARGAWMIRHQAAAANPTFCNGAPVGAEPQPVENNGVISIGPERMKLTVTLEY